MLYTAFTKRCGLIPNEEEYILMGMAPYGRADHAVSIVRDFIDKSNFALSKNVHKGIDNWMPHARHEDLAASIQCVLEWCLEEILREHNGISKNLVFMGGEALN
jgi:carbamoyltransferase